MRLPSPLMAEGQGEGETRPLSPPWERARVRGHRGKRGGRGGGMKWESPLPRWERAKACPGLEPGVRVQGDKRRRGITAHLRNQRNLRFRQHPLKTSPKNPKPILTYPLLMYHNNNQAPPPTRIGTGAQKYRRVKGKRSFYEGYRQSNNETPVCGRDDTGPRQGQVSIPARAQTVRDGARQKLRIG